MEKKETLDRQDLMLVTSVLCEAYSMVVVIDYKRKEYRTIGGKRGSLAPEEGAGRTEHLVSRLRQILEEQTQAEELYELLGQRKEALPKVSKFELEDKARNWNRAKLITGEEDYAVLTMEPAIDIQHEMSILRMAATIDPLTGLQTRKAGEEAVARGLKQGQPSVFVLLDCDKFKFINDKHGHPMGDKVLQTLSKAMQQVFPTAQLTRLGGDEFVIFIENQEFVERTRETRGQTVKDDLMESIKDNITQDLEGIEISVSCGIVYVPGNESPSYNDLYKFADSALYEAKKTHDGRAVYKEFEERRR